MVQCEKPLSLLRL